jgi:very-short-patch-repair endonuclease
MDNMNIEEASADAEPSRVKIAATLAGKINLADFQNAVPAIRELTVLNDTKADYQSLRLVATSEPAFLKSKTWHLDRLGAEQTVRISDLDIPLDGPLLGKLTEAEKAVVTFQLLKEDLELAVAEFPVELLPRNQWGGISYLPDMVAAFVQPNEPAVERLLKQTSEILRKAGKSGAIDGYLNGAKRAWELASAVWMAVGSMGLDYALPPASFEQSGQKVRGPAQIAESGLATCLDLTLLFCAALEQAGLHPIVVFTRGHAFAGVWLKEEEFTTAVVDDVTALRKRVRLKELVLFETTLGTHRPLPKFSYAAEKGAEQISEVEEEKFELAVDIRRARLQRIKPLASSEVAAPKDGPAQGGVIEPEFEEAPDLPADVRQSSVEGVPERPEDRLTRWQRKLLDLSLRNNLLNFKAAKKAVKLDAPHPNELEDLLSEGHAIKLLPRPELMDGKDPRSQAIHEARERENLRRQHALDALKRKEVFVGISPDDMESRLTDLYRSSRAALQEGGSNTLFLALGFLSWTRDNTDSKRFRAPLILVPVSLERKNARSGFSILLHDDEPRFNPTLVEMLRQDFELSLDVVEGELPKDDAGLNVAAIWNTVSDAVKDIKGWEVVDDVVLSTFSFAKYLMWKDLVERTDQLKQNPVVKHLIETPREVYPSSIEFPQARDLDRELPPQNMFCPLPADSSQLSAVAAASKGKDFVLIGPPGTGKSQTIANLIAQCLAEHKRVLFVSEKMAALDVVYRRLRDVGLGHFCLELHSSKARKFEVLEQLRKSWDAANTVEPEDWLAEAERLATVRAQLNRYVERLHVRHSNGMSAYEAIGLVVAGKGLPLIELSWPAAESHDRTTLNKLREAADLLDVNVAAVGERELTTSPLAHVIHSEWSPGWQSTLLSKAAAVRPVVEKYNGAAADYIRAVGLPEIALDEKGRSALALLAKILPDAAGRDWQFVLKPDAKQILEGLHKSVDLVRQYTELHAALPVPLDSERLENINLAIAALTRHRELMAQLAEPWPATVVDKLQYGLRLVSAIAEETRKLSVPYKSKLTTAFIKGLQTDLEEVEASAWPMSWIKRKALIKKLKEAADGPGEPNVESDVQRLVKLDDLRTQVIAITDLKHSTSGVWSSLETDVDIARASISFQNALGAARSHQEWEDVGLEPIGQGACGDTARSDLVRMRELRHLDAELSRLESVAADMLGVWAGYQTDLTVAIAFAAYQSVLQDAKSGRKWTDSGLSAVETGRCGEGPARTLASMRHLVRLEQELHGFADLAQKTSNLWSGLRTKSEDVAAVQAFFTSLLTALAPLAETSEGAAAVRDSVGRLLGAGNMMLEAGGPVAAAGNRYVEAKASLDAVVGDFAIASGLAGNDSAFHAVPATELAEKASRVIHSQGRLNAWCAWRKARSHAIALGLAPLVAAVEHGAVAGGDIRAMFDVAYARWWLNAVVDADDVLRNFVSAEHEKRIRDFRELDERFTKLTQSWVRARLSSGLPSQQSVSRDSEWGVLRYEMNKKSKHLPLRELMSQAPGAVLSLAPCLLMSPLSIAQYLSSDSADFDLVVFDEASQIPVWDAIGAIARGKQVVMVGDPKQLPPTSFFDRAESDSEDIDVESDLESILDECIAANLPTRNLSWHYRSRHESLIAFSNHRYYEGGLVTFPSPVTNDRAVSFHLVSDGLYEKGGARINKPEAKALVADLVSRLKEPGFRESELTVGVVTFNSEQQTLILDLLDEERRKDATIESFFMDTELEPVFVKNLESVQGDERDIMYFSLTYGPTVSGEPSMNFGPMNKQGGERRLNVAITRARHELRVFSSLRPEQLDLSRTQAAGVRDLKHFMEFAERGARALGEAVAGSLGGFDSPFEQAVHAALTAKGWTLHTQVGVSSFRVDLGVVDPDAPGAYLAGVECDGATYHRSATARDRDKLREQVLRGLGWEIVRIWSTDWWIDADSTAEKTHLRLSDLLTKKRAVRAAQEEQAERLAEAAIEAARTKSTVEVPEASTSVGKIVVGSEIVEESSSVYAFNQAATSSPSIDVDATFVEADLASAGHAIDPDAFFDRPYDSTLLGMIEHVINVEGPVRDEVLARRIARAHGWTRTGSRIQDRVVRLAEIHFAAQKEDVGVFFWPKACGGISSIGFRRSPLGNARSVDEISISELTSLAARLRQEGHDEESALTLMARELGLLKLRAASRERLMVAWRSSGESK